jgi:hypothetical protein
MPYLEPSTQEDHPPDSVELDALRLLVAAYISAEGRKKGERLLRAAADILAKREISAAIVVEFIPAKEREARDRVRRQTAAWFRASLPVWFRRLDANE